MKIMLNLAFFTGNLFRAAKASGKQNGAMARYSATAPNRARGTQKILNLHILTNGHADISLISRGPESFKGTLCPVGIREH